MNFVMMAARTVILTNNQQRFLDAMANEAKPIIVCVGPAGTGKTMLACKAAKQSKRKVLFTRPTVTAGSGIGHLPGTLEEKMNPFMAPVLQDNSRNLPRSYEICSLQFMRGRTLTDTFLFADEMQNATISQMKMLLTRIGRDSKIIVCGDENQSDIEGLNGLAHLADLLRGGKGSPRLVEFVELDKRDISRSEAAREVSSLYADSSPPPVWP